MATEQDQFFQPTPSPVSARVVEGLPAVQRVLGLTCGMIAQMPLLAVDGPAVVDPPPVLVRPDPAQTRAWFIDRLVHDWWLHGNAVAYVTAVDPQSGLPAALAWLPADRMMVAQDDRRGPVRYLFDGVELLPEYVLHVKRGADPNAVWRGVGVVEQAMPAWTRVADVEAFQAAILSGAGVPSVVIKSQNADLTQEEADQAKKLWSEKYNGPRRVPAILPGGMDVKTLAWSPADSQLNEARNLSLTDVANLGNLDGYWLGAPAHGLTYKSSAPQFLHLMRQTLGPIMAVFEDMFTSRLVPPGLAVKFDTQAILGDDMGTTVEWARAAVEGDLLTRDEARAYLGKSPLGGEQG